MQTPKQISDRARLIAKHLGALRLDECYPGCREFQDGDLLIEVDLDSTTTVVSIKNLDPKGLSPWIPGLIVSEANELLTYRPDLPLPDGSDWRDRLSELEAILPTETTSQLFDHLRILAGTPDADVMQHLIDLSSLERMGIAAAGWALQLMRQVANLELNAAHG